MHCILASVLFSVAAATPSLNPASDGSFDHVDFYGLRSFDPASIQGLLDLHVGTSTEVDRQAMAEKLRQLEGIADAVVIDMSSPVSSIALVGVLEDGAPTLRLRPAPTGEVYLPEAIRTAYERSLEESMNGYRKGSVGEDRSEGHSLSTYEPARAYQEDLVQFANENRELLRKVLRYSRSAEDRHVAAYAIAYCADKQSIVADLSFAITDPDGHVRNNAVRALSVLAGWANRNENGLILDVDPEALVAMLESLEWTDRNKSAALLDSLTVARNPRLMATLREKSLATLTEMALWHSTGHALFSIRILARLAGLSEEELLRRSQEVGREGYAARVKWVEELVARAS